MAETRHTPDTHVATLLAHLARHRRRLTLLAFASHACTAVTVALFIVAGVLLVSKAMRGIELAALVAGVLLAVALAGFLAFARRPTLDRTARSLDRRLQLNDRVTAALQHRRHDDSIASLIVADATRRLAKANPRDVFPFDLWRRAAVAAIALSAAVMALAFAQYRESRVERTATSTGVSGGASDAAGRGPTIESGTERADGSVEGARNSDQRNASTSRDDANVRPPQEDRRSAAASADLGQRDSATATEDTGTTTSARAPSEAAGIMRSDRTGPGGTAAGANTGPSSDRSARAASDRAEGAGAPAGGGSASDAGSAVPGAGGVEGGARRVEADPRPPMSAPPYRATPSQLRQLRAQAEAALSRDDIPPALRRYVRDYFLALQASAKP